MAHAAGRHYPRRTTTPERTTGWTGWVAFGAIMMILLGVFHAVEGLVAVFNRSYYFVSQTGLVLSVDYTIWGWLEFGLGVLAVVIGAALLTGNIVARVGGVVLAGASAIVHLGFVAAYPIWSVLIIVVDVLVIYAITVHGREMKYVP